ncbi:MAG: hydroxymethylbilane synthase [Acidobacteria bacterium]|nr:hydroxymethylbilane synthase [Acidobacteriota bacterium]NIM60540.1 hydroxymethylbilane synthase [Acidobacteriota bacterium]NIO59511.1 hydroxymethylbilane synthase [Acidobacteriota bacterium]NIQ30540.1 hydroxymethylbilane synthase [Acidobacteriota bacterium]NIQ85488.1 hydroxymethylbilane synthase [Acidobacteriota bacterium]
MSRSSKEMIVGTRGSGLATAQTKLVASAVGQQHPGVHVDLRILKTEGDVRGGAFGPGDRGVFVHAIEQALLDGEIDFAVHSLKDLPSGETAGLVIAAVPRREDPRDALISRWDDGFEGLGEQASVGTGSPRRRGQLLLARPDLRIQPLRGNIDTRAGRVADGDLDAVVLAVAGLVRLGLPYAWHAIDPKVCLPAVGQGALALQARADDRTTIERLSVLEDPSTRFQVRAERAFLEELGGGCMAPATAWAREDSGKLRIDAMVAAIDGEHRFLESCVCDPQEGPDEARRLAQRLNDRGAQHWIELARQSPQPDAGSS